MSTPTATTGVQVRYSWEIDGEEKLCTGCGDWWPADREFFYANGHTGLQNKCKACQDSANKRKLIQRRNQGAARA